MNFVRKVVLIKKDNIINNLILMKKAVFNDKNLDFARWDKSTRIEETCFAFVFGF